LALASIVSACGGSQSRFGLTTDLSPSGRSLGSCAVTVPIEGDICIEYIQSGSATAAGKSASKKGCHKFNKPNNPTTGYFRENACDTSSAFGYCSITESAYEKGEIVKLHQAAVFSPPTTLDFAQTLCNAVFGQYSTTAPKHE
jgi:hypothetical protein